MLETISIDYQAFSALMGMYLTYAVGIYLVSHVITLIRNRSK